MKLLMPFLLALLYCSTAYAGGNNISAGEKKSLLFTHKQQKHIVEAALADSFKSDRNWELYKIEKKAHTGKVMTIAGLSMLGGGTLITLGAAGLTNVAANTDNSPTVAITGAVCCYIVGIGSLVASIPLTVIGAINWSEGNFEKRMYTSTASLTGCVDGNGAGLKLTF